MGTLYMLHDSRLARFERAWLSPFAFSPCGFAIGHRSILALIVKMIKSGSEISLGSLNRGEGLKFFE